MNKLKAQRKRMGLSVGQVASITKTNERRIRRMENGKEDINPIVTIMLDYIENKGVEQ